MVHRCALKNNVFYVVLFLDCKKLEKLENFDFWTILLDSCLVAQLSSSIAEIERLDMWMSIKKSNFLCWCVVFY